MGTLGVEVSDGSEVPGGSVSSFGLRDARLFRGFAGEIGVAGAAGVAGGGAVSNVVVGANGVRAVRGSIPAAVMVGAAEGEIF